MNESNKKALKEIRQDDELLRKYAGLVKCETNTSVSHSSDEDGEDGWVGTKEQWDTYDNVMGNEVLSDEDDRPFFWSEDEEGDKKVYLD